MSDVVWLDAPYCYSFRWLKRLLREVWKHVKRLLTDAFEDVRMP